jgi:hypothetical protein
LQKVINFEVTFSIIYIKLMPDFYPTAHHFQQTQHCLRMNKVIIWYTKHTGKIKAENIIFTTVNNYDPQNLNIILIIRLVLSVIYDD